MKNGYQPVFEMIPEIEIDYPMIIYGIDEIDKEEMVKYFLRIFESDKYEWGTPEYDYWANSEDEDIPAGEDNFPKIHVWVVYQADVYETEDKKIEMVHQNFSQQSGRSEVYRGEAIKYPSDEYDILFEKTVNEYFGKIAPSIILKFKTEG